MRLRPYPLGYLGYLTTVGVDYARMKVAPRPPPLCGRPRPGRARARRAPPGVALNGGLATLTGCEPESCD
jgi:hypothetical protein